MGPPNLYKNGESQPLRCKNSLYKMALVQMDPSKEGTIYKILVANPILNTPKNNKMFGLWRKCEGM